MENIKLKNDICQTKERPHMKVICEYNFIFNWTMVLKLQNPWFSHGQTQKCNSYTLRVSKFSKQVNEE